MINLSIGDINEFFSINFIRRRFLKILYFNIVLIWGFFKKFKVNEIRECIFKVFGVILVVCIYYLDEIVVFI